MTKVNRIHWAVMFFIGVSINVNAQSVFKTLQVGDKIPDLVLTNTRNYTHDKLRLSDFRGKVLILDFWNKYCSNCIAGFPKMEALQAKFSDDIQILLVTSDSEETVNYLFKNSPIVKKTKLPFIINDSLLNRLFPHVGVPFHVWIDANGIVKAKVTAQNEATPENVQAILAGKEFDTPIFIPNLDFNIQKPLIVEGEGRQWNHLQYYSMIMRGIVGQNISVSGSFKSPITNDYMINSKRMLNVSVMNLFTAAYGVWAKIIVEGKHTEDFFQPEDKTKIDAWKDTMVFSYEAVWPIHLQNKRQQIMQQELQNYFGVIGSIEKRRIKCYILYKTSLEDRLASKGGSRLFENTADGWVIKNRPFSGLLRMILRMRLISTKSEPVIIDETGYDKKKLIDMNIKNDLRNLLVLQEELNKYGIGIKQEEREIDCLILKDSY